MTPSRIITIFWLNTANLLSLLRAFYEHICVTVEKLGRSVRLDRNFKFFFFNIIKIFVVVAARWKTRNIHHELLLNESFCSIVLGCAYKSESTSRMDRKWDVYTRNDLDYPIIYYFSFLFSDRLLVWKVGYQSLLKCVLRRIWIIWRQYRCCYCIVCVVHHCVKVLITGNVSGNLIGGKSGIFSVLTLTAEQKQDFVDEHNRVRRKEAAVNMYEMVILLFHLLLMIRNLQYASWQVD